MALAESIESSKIRRVCWTYDKINCVRLYDNKNLQIIIFIMLIILTSNVELKRLFYPQNTIKKSYTYHTTKIYRYIAKINTTIQVTTSESNHRCINIHHAFNIEHFSFVIILCLLIDRYANKLSLQCLIKILVFIYIYIYMLNCFLDILKALE